jgi:uncharacterized coiled-coil DUF342 family protein
MNDTPTPETDALYRDDHRPNLIEHARKLERERDEAREYADKLAEGLPDGMLPKDVEVLREANLGLATELATVTAQRDEARETIATMEIRHAAVMLHTQSIVDEANQFREQRDRLAEALRYCREDSAELLGERDWWQSEPRCDYAKRWQETHDNLTRADEALQSLTPNAEP